MSARSTARCLLLLAATALVVLAIPAAASAATLTASEAGSCCGGGSPYPSDGSFADYQMDFTNDSGGAIDMDTLRVSYDPRTLQWDHAATAARYYGGWYDVLGDVWVGFDYDNDGGVPIPGAACTEESSTVALAVVACDLEGVTIPDGQLAELALRALKPVDGFEYGDATVDFEISFVGAPIAPLTDSVTSTWQEDASSNLQVTGGYVADPDLVDRNFTGSYRDFDGESTGIKYNAGDTVPYRFLLTNPTHSTDPTGLAHGITIAFNIPTDAGGDWETQFQAGNVTATGSLTSPSCVIDSDNGTDQDWVCSFGGHVPVDGSAMVTLPVLLVDGVDLGGGSGAIEFDISPVNGVIDSLDIVDENTYGSPEACQLPRFFGERTPGGGPDEFDRYQMHATASISALQSGDPVRFEIPCLEPEAAPKPNFNSMTGIWDPVDGYISSDHLGHFTGALNNPTLSWATDSAQAPGANGEYAFTWEEAGLTGLAAGDVLDTFRWAAAPAAGGDYMRVMVHITVQETTDLSVALSGAASTALGAGGAEQSYTATVSNAGPDEATNAKATITLPSTASYVSSAAAAGGDSCTRAGQVVTCNTRNLPSGQARTFTVVAKYTPGASGLSLPATATTNATVVPVGAWASDPSGANDSSSHALSLTALTPVACPDGQTGTPPNCTTPPRMCATGTTGTFPYCVTQRRFFGTGADRKFRGGFGNDRLVGSTGNETFLGGPGNDRGLGGSGIDRLFGGLGNDFMSGGVGNDVLSGGPGRDVLTGGYGDDRISCGTGGRDRAFGGPGNDTIICRDGFGGDLLNGGPGVDDCVGDVGDLFVGCERIVRVKIRR